ncbi:RHS repeat-associated core domain-containing protein [Paenibacillus sp. YYML68]|uniref:RHS repeat-associated core domain-containing protein n=1 Tax=Paenibacillus sp. YYML68 TaxID=2909250 RepID=UPI0024913A00|nr:RHS repeat-associated core domain-containing protein [Paenibacillus sp. YYML68]
MIDNTGGLSQEDVDKQIELLYDKLVRQLTFQNYVEDTSKKPAPAISIEFSDLYKGLDFEEIQRWMTYASSNLLTGNYVEQYEDFKVEEVKNPIRFERTYNSLASNTKGIMGNGWQTNLEAGIKITSNKGNVSASSLNVRTKPYGTVIGHLSYGSNVEILQKDDQTDQDGGKWHKIKYDDRLKGKEVEAYVASWHISENEAVMVSYPSGTKALYEKTSEGRYKSPVGIFDTLTLTADGYDLVLKDLTKYHFNSHGKLLTLSDRYGNTITYSYSGEKVSKLSDPTGRELIFEYNSAGLVSKITGPDSRTYTYEYDNQNNLIKVTDAMGHKRQYTYDALNRIHKVTDANGHQVVRNEYDILGRIVRQYDANDIISYFIYSDGTKERFIVNGKGVEFKFQFNQDMKQIQEVDAFGGINQTHYYVYFEDPNDAYTNDWVNVTDLSEEGSTASEYKRYMEIIKKDDRPRREYIYDRNQNLTTIEYDSRNNLVETTDALNNKETTVYDSKDNVITITDKKGGVQRYEYDVEGVALIKETDPLGYSTTYSYYTNEPGIVLKGLVKTVTDKRGNRTTYRYEDIANHLTSITNVDGAVITRAYDSYGRILEEKDANGNVSKYAYNAMGLIIMKEDPYGNKVHLEYDKVGNKVAETDKLGNRTEYKYDAKNQLIEKKDSLGGIQYLKYDVIGNKIEEINSRNAKTEYGYDELNRNIKITDALGFVTLMEFDSNGNRTQIKDALGNVTKFEYDKLNRVIKTIFPDKSTEKTEYDAKGNVLKKIDRRGYDFVMTYDKLDRVLTEKDPYQRTIVHEYDPNGNEIKLTDKLHRSVVREYDAMNRLIMETNPHGDHILRKYDLNGNLVEETDVLGRKVTFEYDKLNRKIKEVASLNKTTLFAYDDNGNMTTLTNAKGQTQTYVYDAVGRTVKTINALGDATKYEYDAAGNLVAVSDAMGRVTKAEYDLLNRKTKESDAFGNASSFEYDGVGNKISEMDKKGNQTLYSYDAFKHVIKVTDPNGNFETMEYDANGNNTKRIDKRGNVTLFAYDRLNRLVETTDPYLNKTTYTYDHVGNKLSIRDGKGYTTSFVYDDLNRLIEEKDPIGNVKKTEYDAAGNKTAAIDREGNKTVFTYDDLDRMVSVTDPDGMITRYTYNLMGKLTEQTDGRGLKTLFEYDVLDRVIKRVDPMLGAEEFSYDKVDNLISKMDRNGVTTTYTYDPLNRLLKEAAAGVEHSYIYDEIGNRLSMMDGTGKTTYHYDNLNRVIKKTLPDGKALQYQYDAAGNLTKLTDPGSYETIYTFDKMNRMETVTTAEGTTRYSYDKNGNRESLTLPNGTKSQYEFDHRNLLKKLTNTITIADSVYSPAVVSGTHYSVRSVGASVYEAVYLYEYGYNKNGFETYKIEAKGRTDVEYDKLGRVKKMKEPDGKITTYSYDSSGNRSGQTVTGTGMSSTITYTYDNRNRLTHTVEVRNGETTTTTFIYDQNGNQTNVVENGPVGTKQSEYDFDVFNRLVTSQTDGVSSTYTYNGDGLRVTLASGGKSTTYYYSGKEVVYELDSLGTESHSIRGINLVARKNAMDVSYYVFNGHGDVVQLVNPKGVIVNSYDYDVFGNTIISNETVDNPYRYSGYTYDKATGYYYLKARYYDPKTARFISEDTYRGTQTDPLSLNLYTYVNNSPLQYHDPDGNWGIVATIGIGVAVGFVAGSVVNFGIQAFEKGMTNVNAGEVLKAGVKGAIGGAFMGGAGLIGGNLLVQGTASVTAGAVGNLTGDAVFGEINSLEKAVVSLAVGGVGSVAGLVTGRLAEAGTKKALDQYRNHVINKLDNMNRADAKRYALKMYGKQTGQETDDALINKYFKEYRDELRVNPDSASKLLARTIAYSGQVKTISTETFNEAVNKRLIEPNVNQVYDDNKESWKKQWNDFMKSNQPSQVKQHHNYSNYVEGTVIKDMLTQKGMDRLLEASIQNINQNPISLDPLPN